MSILSPLWLRLRAPKVARALKSVVYIETEQLDGSKTGGTGFVIADDMVCTCKHVIKGASRITVKTADGKTFDVPKGLAYEGIIADMALLEVNNLGLAPIEIDPVLPTINEDNTVFIPTRTRKGLRAGRGRLSFRDADELIFVRPNLSSITQQKELSVVIKESQKGDSGSPVFTRDGKVRLMVNAYMPTAVVKFTDNPNAARGLALYAVTLCCRMESVLRDADALGLTE